MPEKYTQILLPKGEWLGSLVKSFAMIEMPIVKTRPSDRCYQFNFVDQGIIPITFTLARSRNVIELLSMEETTANAGFTGSDIVEEQDANKLARWDFKLVSQVMSPSPFLYLGSTPNLRNQFANPTVYNLAESIIFTTYPRITERYLQEKGVTAKIVVPMDGGIEILWGVTPANLAIVDIGQTLETAKENEIEVMDDQIIRPEITFVQTEMISPQDQLRCDELREKIYLAQQKQR